MDQTTRTLEALAPNSGNGAWEATKGSAWVAHMARTHRGTVTVLVTPDLARALLERNTANRPIRAEEVRRHAWRIKNGRWINTHEPIIVTTDATLNDGQHRLAAIVMSGVACEMDIYFGAERAAFDRTGIGLKRSPGEILTVSGLGAKNANLIAAIAKGVYWIDAGQSPAHGKYVDPADIVRVARNQTWVTDVALRVKSTPFPCLARAWVGICCALIIRAGNTKEDAFEFMTAVERRAGGGEGQKRERIGGAALLHDRLVKERGNRASLPPVALMALFLRAWNAWAEDRLQSTLLSLREDENFPAAVLRPRPGRPRVARPAANGEVVEGAPT